MKLLNLCRRTCAVALILAVGSYGVTAPVLADIVSTSDLLAQERLESAREQVITLLQKDEVAARLTEMGVDLGAAQERVDSLTASELEVLAQQIETLPAGEGALGTIALVLVILILLDVAGVTDIFPAV